MWNEPRAPEAPSRSRWDWLLVGLLLIAAVIGAAFEPDLVWRPAAGAAGFVVVPMLLWRRVEPLWTLLVGAIVLAVLDLVANPPDEKTTTVGAAAVATLMLIYAVVRWGSGREALIGLTVMVTSFLFVELTVGNGPWSDLLTGTIFLLFWAALGAVMRYRAGVRIRRVEEARLAERQLLARELHDSVAHHVSAIAVQAQAGRAIAAKDPDAALEVLSVIGEAASRTLTDMRRMVGALRDDGGASVTPQAGLDDIRRLADGPSGRVPVDVEVPADLGDVSAPVAAALFRLTQEAVTNARKHARHATRIAVSIDGDESEIRLRVSDDGDPPTMVGGAGASGGFGLVGMAERTSLLGGRFDAGPGPDRGWVVEATLPREGTEP